MTAGIGVYGLGQVFAQTIAPTFAVPVALRFGYGTLYVGNIVLISICLVIALFMKIRSSKPRLRSYSYNLKKMIYLPATLPATMTMVNSIAKSSIRAFLVIFAATMDIVNIGIFFTVQAVTISVTRPILSKLADRFGLTRILIPCEIFTVAGLVIVSFAHGLAGFLVASVIIGIGTSGEQPILMSECVRSASPDKRGNASNTSYVGTDIGGFVGSNLAGIAVAYLGYRYMYRVFALPVIVLTVIYTILQARRQRALDAEAIQDGIAS
jgi:MFS family permease